MSALQRAIEIAGGPSALAERIGGNVKAQHVVNWRNRGVPIDRVKEIVRATDGRVSAHDLRPELFPEGFEFPPEHPPATASEAAA